MKEIGSSDFYNCKNLLAFEVSGQHPNYISVGGVLFNKDMTELVYAPAGIEKYTIPDGVKTIGFGAFRGNSHLREVIIPESVTTISDGSFSGCGALKRITIPENVTVLDSGSFWRCGELSEAVFLGDAPPLLERGWGEHLLFDGVADDFKILYDPEKEGWSTPLWYGYPAQPMPKGEPAPL